MAKLGNVPVNLRFRQGSTQNVLIKDGTADALQGLGVQAIGAVKNYQKYRKVQQAMNFQADVIEGTLGGRQGDDDPYYDALEVGHNMTTAHTEFMAEVKAEPRYAEMSREEFRGVYDAAMQDKWEAFQPESVEGFKVFASAGLASQKEALTWQAGANATYKHSQAVQISGNSLLDVASTPDPDGMGAKTFDSRINAARGPSLSQGEWDALVVNVAAERAQAGDRRLLTHAIAKGLHKNAQHVDSITRAGAAYKDVVHKAMVREAYTALGNLETLADNGEYKDVMGKAFIDKYAKYINFSDTDPTKMTGKEYLPLVAHIRRMNKKALGNAAKLEVEDVNIKAYLAGDLRDFAEYPQSFQNKVIEEADSRVNDMGLSMGWSDEELTDYKLKLAMNSGQPSSSLKAIVSAGFGARQIVDGKASKQLVRALDIYNKAIDSKHGKFFADMLAGSKENAYTANFIRKATWGGGSVEEAVRSRVKELETPYNPNSKQRAEDDDYLKEELNKSLLNPTAWGKVKNFFGADPTISNYNQLMPQFKHMVERDIIDHGITYKQAVDDLIPTFQDRTTHVGTQLLSQTEGELKSLMGIPSTYRGSAQDAVRDYFKAPTGFGASHDIDPADLENLKYTLDDTSNVITARIMRDDGTIDYYDRPVDYADVGRYMKFAEAERQEEVYGQDKDAWSTMVRRETNSLIDDIATGRVDIGSLGLTEDAVTNLTDEQLNDIVGNNYKRKRISARVVPEAAGSWATPGLAVTPWGMPDVGGSQSLSKDSQILAFAKDLGDTELVDYLGNVSVEQSDESRIRLMNKIKSIMNTRILNNR